jgi:hypothetical protein
MIGTCRGQAEQATELLLYAAGNFTPPRHHSITRRIMARIAMEMQTTADDNCHVREPIDDGIQETTDELAAHIRGLNRCCTTSQLSVVSSAR